MLLPRASLRARPAPSHGALLGIALAFAALAGAGCEETEGPDMSTGRVHGSVRDAESGATLKGVRVRFISDTLDEVEGRSNGEGHYSLQVESRTPHGRLEAKKGGYETRVVSVYLDAPEVRIDLRLNPEP